MNYNKHIKLENIRLLFESQAVTVFVCADLLRPSDREAPTESLTRLEAAIFKGYHREGWKIAEYFYYIS